MKFSSYNLKKNIVEIINALGYVDATPIQDNVLPKILKNKSLLCKAETGSGKTHAFLIPLINNIDIEIKDIQVVIISPTIELASQTYSFASDIVKSLEGISVHLLTSNSQKDISSTSLINSKNAKIVIGTPGRVYDTLISNKQVNIKNVKCVVLDECDMLLDDAYVEQINEILRTIVPLQRLAFTATMKEHLLAWTKKSLQVDEVIDVNKKDKVNANVKHHLVNIKHKDIVESLVNFLSLTNPFYTIVFASQKTQVERVHNALNKLGINSALITGDLETRERKITMRRIRNGDFKLIISSDIASRGIDLEDVTCVISLDLPLDLDYYYHRAGRTGRNNKAGDSYIFYNDEDKNKINSLIEKSKINFDYYVLRSDSLKKIDSQTSKKKREVNENLEKEIKKAVAKARSKTVKPGYKKKVKKAAEKAKWFHKRKIMKANLRAQAKDQGIAKVSKK